MNQTVKPAKRARTDAQKAARREAILEAAESHLREVGFEHFSMATLGKAAGVAKGTLYLYFETREEVLLALHQEKLRTWCRSLIESFKNQQDDLHFLEQFYETFSADTVHVVLLCRLDSVIEHNISLSRLIEHKRAFAAEMTSTAEQLAINLQLSVQQAEDLIASLGAMMIGVSQVDMGPAYQNDQLPVDVQQIVASFDSRRLFLRNGSRILGAIRGERRNE